MSDEARPRRVTIKLTEEEYAMLVAVAENDGLSLSDWIRLTCRKAFKALKK